MSRAYALKLAILLSLIVPSPAAAAKKKAKSTCGAKDFAGCPLKGCGGDPELNRKKNRRTRPAVSGAESVTLSDIANFTFPKEWAVGTKRALLEEWGEGRLVQVTAFVIHAKNYPSGVESCNCNLKKNENNDFHLVLVDSKGKPEEKSVTAEISPHIRPSGWTITKLRSLARSKAYVRVTGLALLDTQHLKRPIKRLTNWEIHPVTAFEVCADTKAACDRGEGWQDLSDTPEP